MKGNPTMKFASAAALLFAFSIGPIVEACDGNKTGYDLISLQGKVLRQAKETLDKSGEFNTAEAYYLQTSDDNVPLPVHKHCNGELKVDFPVFIGQNVTIKARGIQKRGDDGHTLSYVHEVVSIKEKPSYDSITLRGRIVREENQTLDEKGTVTTTEAYRLETSDSQIDLPAHTDIRPLVGRNVTVAALGLQKPNREGKMLSYIHQVVSVRDSERSTQITANPFAAN